MQDANFPFEMFKFYLYNIIMILKDSKKNNKYK